MKLNTTCLYLFNLASSDWLSTNDNLPEQQLEVQFPEKYTEKDLTNITYLLCMGLEFGNVGFGGKIEPVKYAGAGRCMLVK